jgi:synaptobrevin family protein YKT6
MFRSELPSRRHADQVQILKNEQKPAIELCAERDLSSYSRFTRTSVGEFMSLFSKTVAERTKPGQRQDVEEQSYTFHAYARSEGVAGIIISDQEYPALVAHQLLGKILDEFLSKFPRSAWENSNGEVPFPQLKEYITKYQDPAQADSIMKVGARQLPHLRGHASVLRQPLTQFLLDPERA